MSRVRASERPCVNQQQKNALAHSLYLRCQEGQVIKDFRPISGDPDRMRGMCHENVDSSLGEFPGAVAVRGWFYDRGEADGVAKFSAHSVIEISGSLIEITYSNADQPFIRHVGSIDDFWEIARSKPPTIRHVYDDVKRIVFEAAKVESLFGLPARRARWR